VERLRSDLGVNAKFVFGVFGHLRESKRLNAVLRAFEVVRRSADVAVLVAGDFASSDLERAVGRALSGSAIIRKPYLSERDFWLHAAAVDACINLRYPAAGETSGVAIRLMGIGKPVILSQGVEASEYPDAACIQVETGAREQAMLDAAMLWLAQSRADAVEIGARARTYVREHHAIERVAASYWRVLEEAALL
jgi:glycosyltransferase involved in cell wall biosynthesis